MGTGQTNRLLSKVLEMGGDGFDGESMNPSTSYTMTSIFASK